MFCEKCGGKSHVTDSRHAATIKVIRRSRECLKCRRRWSTVEMAAGTSATPKQRRKRSVKRPPLMTDIKRREYATVAIELRALAEKVERGEMT